jgi:hypothetical protein
VFPTFTKAHFNSPRPSIHDRIDPDKGVRHS